MDLFLVFTVLFVALVFTYTNGFHDTANAIATVVGTSPNIGTGIALRLAEIPGQ